MLIVGHLSRSTRVFNQLPMAGARISQLFWVMAVQKEIALATAGLLRL